MPDQARKIGVVFEDESLLVLAKPVGWVVNEASTTKNQLTIQSWLRTKSYPLAKNESFRSGIVHRLDKDTSGLLLVAKTQPAFRALQEQFKNRRVEKTYLALVHGKVQLPAGSIKATVGRLPWNRRRFGVLPGGRDAQTDYQVSKRYIFNNQVYSLLTIKPKTGRTHQIRIHFKHLGHPVVGDSFYAGRKTARNDGKWCPRLFLHAAGISFTHPVTQQAVSFSLPLPEDLSRVLEPLLPQTKA